MRTINELEREIQKICNKDFVILTVSKYKEKQISLTFGEEVFSYVSTTWEGAIEAVFMQVKKYQEGYKNGTRNC